MKGLDGKVFEGEHPHGVDIQSEWAVPLMADHDPHALEAPVAQVVSRVLMAARAVEGRGAEME